ncbi:hypothetical protein [Dapis sp. BLCC M172]|uniref:hypothetical protein n=1 Tax=Dapis sp. BLCC M172 TaxID=2975281 RepID=UPI003CEF4565
MELPVNSCFTLVKYFHPSHLSGKPQTFSFSEAPEKIDSSGDRSFHPVENHKHFHSLKLLKKVRRAKGFFPIAMSKKFSSYGTSRK